MPLTLNELYTQTKHQYHLSMIAGETGIDHIMNWVYVSEDSSTHDFLKGGELIITTGINCQDEASLYDFIETIEKEFVMENVPYRKNMPEDKGIDEVKEIGRNFGINDINLIKPGIGGTTRVLLRRLPWKILIDERYKGDPQLEHLVRLAQEKNVPIEYYQLTHYKCCGIIKKIADA